MAYKSKYLEASKKRLNGDNPNNIDKKAIDERIKRSEEEWARNRKKMAKYHTPEAKVTNRYKDARSGFEALQYNPSLDTSTYDKFYKEYQKSANDYKELLKKEERKAIANMLNPFDDVKKEKAFSNYRDSKSKLKAAKKEEYEQKQNFNTQLLKNKTIAGYAKAIVDNEELRKKSYFTENGQLEPYQEYLYTTSTQKAVEAEKQLEKLNINISDLTDTYRRSKSVQQQKDIAKFANDNPVLASALSVMGTMDVKSNVGALAQTAGEGVKSVITDEYVPVDNGTDTFIASRASNTIRSTVYQKIYEYYGGGLGMDEFNGTEPSEETKKENEKRNSQQGST